jgi:hypothetical protein
LVFLLLAFRLQLFPSFPSSLSFILNFIYFILSLLSIFIFHSVFFPSDTPLSPVTVMRQ